MAEPVRRPPAWLSPKRWSLTTRLFLRLLPVLALAAALPWMLAYWLDRGWEVAVPSVLVLLALMWWTLRLSLIHI